MPTKVTIDIGQLFLALPKIQKFIVDISDQSLTTEGKIKVVSDFTFELLVSTEAVVHQDLLNDELFKEAMNSLVVFAIAGLDSYTKVKALVDSIPKV